MDGHGSRNRAVIVEGGSASWTEDDLSDLIAMVDKLSAPHVCLSASVSGVTALHYACLSGVKERCMHVRKLV